MTTQEEAFDKKCVFFSSSAANCDGVAKWGLWWTPCQTEASKPTTSPSLTARCAVQRPINCSHKGGISIFPGTKSLPYSCIESMFFLSLSLSGFIYFFHWPRHQLLKKCFAFYLGVILSRFTSFLLQSFSLHQTAIVWARGENTEGERWGLGMCLACCTIATRLSVSNDALIISTLELGCCIEWQYHPDAMYIAVVSLLACQSFFISLCLRCSSLLSFLHQPFCLLLLHFSSLHCFLRFFSRAAFFYFLLCLQCNIYCCCLHSTLACHLLCLSISSSTFCLDFLFACV